MNSPPFRFSSKADTLERLSSLLRSAVVPPLRVFPCAEWRTNPSLILGEIKACFGGSIVAVRSSAENEDGAACSMAGAFLSLLDVNSGDWHALTTAIDRVCSVMPAEDNNHFFIQRMVQDVVMSGVVMTRDISTGAPYYVVNYDDESGRTDTVTGGTRTNKTLYVFRETGDESVHSARIRKVLGAVREIEGVCGTLLDVEFALDSSCVFHVLQVRPISTSQHWGTDVSDLVKQSLLRARTFMVERFEQHDPELAGTSRLYGPMPDWNPAELIGQTPKPLAESIFRRFISRSVWRQARGRMGYRNPVGRELMINVLGHPLIDVRASFNSLLPADLPNDIANRLVNAWLDNLADHPELHDKIEFSITQTCIDFSFNENFELKTRGQFNFDEKRLITTALLSLTRNALDLGASGTLNWALRQLSEHRDRQLRRPLGKTSGWFAAGALNTVSAVVEQGIEFGSLPFSIVARHAFIAEALLRSAIDRGALSVERLGDFRRSLGTVTSSLAMELGILKRGGDPERFVREFGHLRPGTFDINSPRYADRLPQLIGNGLDKSQPNAPDPFSLAASEELRLDNLLRECGLEEVSSARLLEYARRAIVGREFGKFVMSRDVSDILENLAAWGTVNDLERSQVASLSVDIIEDIARVAGRPSLRDDIKFLVDQSEIDHKVACSTRLPALIRHPDDVFVAALQRAQPNLFGRGVLRAEIRELSATDDWSTLMRGKVACIESADPGFDWVFGTGAVGLVTKYGGANSHMAIRCMEIGLPAAIGCGEQLYSRITEAGSVELNFDDSAVRPLHAY